MSEFVDYYEILQVHPKADPEVIEKAYKTLIFKHHPDRGGDEETAKRITGAYYVLSDPSRRSAFDREREARFAAPSVRSEPPARSVRLEDIPPEVIDLLVARYWVEGAAATARTAGRVAGAVAVESARVAGRVAVAGIGVATEIHTNLAARDAERKAERSRELERMARAQEDFARQRSAQEAKRGWRTPVSPRALGVYVYLLGRLKIDDWQARQSLADLTAEDLLWFSVRYYHSVVRKIALELIVNRMPDKDVLAGQRGWLGSPLILATVSPRGTEALGAKVTKGPIVNVARLLSIDEYSAWVRSNRRTQIMLACAVVCIGLLGYLVSGAPAVQSLLTRLGRPL